MRDPHVEVLLYWLESSEVFDNPPPITLQQKKFSGTLRDGELKVEMHEHFSSEREARAEVEPFLEAWEIAAALANGRRLIRFQYREAKLIDRDPPPEVSLATRTVVSHGTDALIVERPKLHAYPSEPCDFVASADVQTMWNRFEGYQKGREPLPAMAYFCLTVLELRAGQGKDTRERAAKLLSVEPKVLNQLGNLTTNCGDYSTARKVDERSTGKPFTQQEIVWIEAALRSLIRQVGRKDAGAQLDELSMKDLPKL
jgi:hypothetical protein